MSTFQSRTNTILSVLWQISYVAIAAAVTALISAVFYGWQLQQNPTWEYGALLGQNVLVFITALVCANNARRGEISSMWDSIVWMQFFYWLGNFAANGLGWWYGIIIVLLTLAIASQLPAERTPRWVVIIGFIFGGASLLVDLAWPIGRPDIFEAFPIAPYLLFGVLILFLAYSSLRDFSQRSLSTKLSVTFVAVGFITVVPVILYLNSSTRATLIARENEKLLTTAKQTALSVNEFIDANLNAISTEAQFKDFIVYLGLFSSARRASELEIRAIATLTTLAGKDKTYVESYTVLDRNGFTLIDTTFADIGNNHSEDEDFKLAIQGDTAVMSDILFDEQGRAYLYFSAPVKNADDFVMGILRVRYDAAILQSIVREYNSQAGLGSFGILFDENFLRLAHGRSDEQRYRLVAPLSDARMEALKDQKRLPNLPNSDLLIRKPDLEQKLLNIASQPSFTAEVGEGTNDASNQTIERAAATMIKEKPWIVLFAQDESAATEPLKDQTRVISLLILITAGGISVISVAASRLFSRPIERLSHAASQIIAGDLNVQLPIQSNDEFGLLSRTFNNMTTQIRQSVFTLADRVAERTRDLETQADRIQAALEVGNVVSSIRNLDELLPKVTQMVSERFNYYHVAIFLLDERGQKAILRAANSPGGQHMLARGHQLGVGETGIVGYVAATGQPRITSNVGQDNIYYNNPDLPNTRSEMAVPLVVAGKVLGAMDLQSEAVNAFSDEDVSVLRVVADHVGVAIENARLIGELENAVEATRRAYGEVSRRAWVEFIRQRTTPGFLCNLADQIVPITTKLSEKDLGDALPQVMAGNLGQIDAHTLALPVKIRDTVAGAIRLQKSELDRPWTAEEINLIKGVVDQLGVALENARLYRETQLNAARDRMISETTDKMRRAADMDSLIRVALSELSHALGANEAFIQFATAQDPQNILPGGNGNQKAPDRMNAEDTLTPPVNLPVTHGEIA